MEPAVIKKWVLFFSGILGAIILADALSTILVSAAGIEGSMKFLAGFIVYAVLFFAILYGIEKVFHIEFFSFWRE